MSMETGTFLGGFIALMIGTWMTFGFGPTLMLGGAFALVVSYFEYERKRPRKNERNKCSVEKD